MVGDHVRITDNRHSLCATFTSAFLSAKPPHAPKKIEVSCYFRFDTHKNQSTWRKTTTFELKRLLSLHGSCACTSLKRTETGSPRFARHVRQNHSPSGHAFKGGVQHARWYSASHESHNRMSPLASLLSPHIFTCENKTCGSTTIILSQRQTHRAATFEGAVVVQ